MSADVCVCVREREKLRPREREEMVHKAVNGSQWVTHHYKRA